MRGDDTLQRQTGSCREHSPKGIYILLIRGRECNLTIGSLGERRFSSGWYGYIGSAQGTGGFARVRRHQALAVNRDRPPHWHIDYLLLNPQFRLCYIICGHTEDDCECCLADILGPPEVPGFGCSDCGCSSHLFYRMTDPRQEALRAFERLGISSVIKTIKSLE
jgi:Uri superfamily endonuclease